MGGACFERVGAHPPLGGASFVCGNRGMLVFGSVGGATPEPIKKILTTQLKITTGRTHAGQLNIGLKEKR